MAAPSALPQLGGAGRRVARDRHRQWRQDLRRPAGHPRGCRGQTLSRLSARSRRQQTLRLAPHGLNQRRPGQAGYDVCPVCCLCRHCEERKRRSNQAFAPPNPHHGLLRFARNDDLKNLPSTHHRPLRLDDLEHPREFVHQRHQLASRIALPMNLIFPAPTASGKLVCLAITSSSVPRARVKPASAFAACAPAI